MNWQSQFVVLRVTTDKKVTQVFETSDLQKAKYWIKYIAQTADVLCRTPLSPKHSQVNTKPEYWSHKEASGQPVTDQQAWLNAVKAAWPEFEFPDQQADQTPDQAPA